MDGVIVILGVIVTDGVAVGVTVLVGVIEIVGVRVGVTLIVGVGEAETLGTTITFDAAGPPTLQNCFTLKYKVPESAPIDVVLGEIQPPAL